MRKNSTDSNNCLNNPQQAHEKSSWRKNTSRLSAVKEVQNKISRQESATRMRSNKTVACTVMIMTVGFYVCWTPYAIRCVLDMFGVDLTALLSSLTLLFAKLGVVINPCIYIFHNKEVSSFLVFYGAEVTLNRS